MKIIISSKNLSEWEKRKMKEALSDWLFMYNFDFIMIHNPKP